MNQEIKIFKIEKMKIVERFYIKCVGRNTIQKLEFSNIFSLNSIKQLFRNYGSEKRKLQKKFAVFTKY